MKPPTCTEEDHVHHSNCLVSGFCLLSPALPPQHTHVLRPQTITPEGSAKNLWNVPQDIWHGNRYGNQDTEDVLDVQDSTPLHLEPQETTLCWIETTIHLMNIVRRLTLTAPWLTYQSNSNSLITNLQV